MTVLKQWIRSETGIRCILALSLFLFLSLCILVYESSTLITEFRSLIFEKISGTEAGTVSQEQMNAEIRLLVEKHQKEFLSAIVLLLLGITVFSLILSLKHFLPAPENPDTGHQEKKEDISHPLSEKEDNTDNPASPDSLSELLEKAGKLGKEIRGEDLTEEEFSYPPEHMDMEMAEEENTGVIAHSYNKMVEALQKINELEKKHSVELAKANELLEKEVKERKMAEKEIRYLSGKLLSSIEDAQKKLARDLHDEFGQTLAALHMGVEALWNSEPERPEARKESFERLVDLIEQLGDRIRSISSDLRPDLLDDLGLIPTLEWYVKEFMEQHTDIQVHFQAIGFKKRVTSEFELILYRIFQESMNNIVKHSKAQTVNAMLTYSYPKVILMIKDDGVGFDLSGRSGGIGLIGMRERVVSVKGSIDIRSEKGKGTTVRAELPVS